MILLPRHSARDGNLEKALALDKKEQPLKILHIAGAGRSGSTILEKTIGSIDGVTSLGEIYYIWQRGFSKNQLCGCGRPFDECAFWQEIRARIFPEGETSTVKSLVKTSTMVARNRHVPLFFIEALLPRFRSRVAFYAEHILKLYREAARTSGARVLIDSSKHAHGHILAEIPDIELYVLHLVRDARATAYSWTRSKVYEKQPAGTTKMPQYHPLTGSLYWCSDNLTAALLRHRCENYMLMRYEEFTRDPQRLLKRIFDFIGEPQLPMPVAEDHTVDLTIQHSVSGNPVRFKQGQTVIKPDEEWQKAMSRATQTAVLGLAWPLMARYGYFSKHNLQS